MAGRYHPERLLRPPELVQVDFDDQDAVVAGEALAKSAGEPWVQLEGRHVPGAYGERRGQPTVGSTDIDDVMAAAHLRVLHDRAGPPVSGKEVLASRLTPSPPRWRGRRGHGTPEPCP